jgi:hypothetical protein
MWAVRWPSMINVPVTWLWDIWNHIYIYMVKRYLNRFPQYRNNSLHTTRVTCEICWPVTDNLSFVTEQNISMQLTIDIEPDTQFQPFGIDPQVQNAERAIRVTDSCLSVTWRGLEILRVLASGLHCTTKQHFLLQSYLAVLNTAGAEMVENEPLSYHLWKTLLNNLRSRIFRFALQILWMGHFTIYGAYKWYMLAKVISSLLDLEFKRQNVLIFTEIK